MQHSPGRRALALLAGLLVTAAVPAVAQDTTGTGRATIDTSAPTGAIDTATVDSATTDSSAIRDTTDTSGVRNPAGYQEMERDTAGGYGDGGTHHDSTAVGETESRVPKSEEPRLEPSGGDSTR